MWMHGRDGERAGRKLLDFLHGMFPDIGNHEHPSFPVAFSCGNLLSNQTASRKSEIPKLDLCCNVTAAKLYIYIYIYIYILFLSH
jgi:hypothetical protein